MAFHDVRFPTAISFGARGGPERRTEIVALGSGREERNQRWADSKRRYEAGYGVKSLGDIHAVVAFFEERRGRFHGFRWRDAADGKSCAQSATPAASDQMLGEGDGARASFQLSKTYGSAFAPWTRTIAKLVEGTLLVAIDGAPQAEGVAFTCDYATGVLTFDAGHIPADGAIITAGFEFDVPVRFDTDRLEISLDGFHHGSIPSIPIVEIRP
jgi:uncharacterized protein (TIGR02217 family)